MTDFSNIATAFYVIGLDHGRNYDVDREFYEKERILNKHMSPKELADMVRSIKEQDLISKGIDILDQGPKEVRYELQPGYKGEVHLSVQDCLGIRVSLEFRANAAFDTWHTVLDFHVQKKR